MNDFEVQCYVLFHRVFRKKGDQGGVVIGEVDIMENWPLAAKFNFSMSPSLLYFAYDVDSQTITHHHHFHLITQF